MKKTSLKNETGRVIMLLLAFIVFLHLPGLSQTGTVTGKVLASQNDSTMAGVTVRVKGGNTTVMTGPDGAFAIKAGANATLIISNIGYATQEVPVNNRTNLSVRLIADAQSLQGVVVIGYGTAKKRDLTGSVSSVSAETIAKVPVISVDQALQGRASGVQVINNDGSPGGNISVLIRGIGSLASGGNQPLYIVDGYPVTGGMNNFNPADIASIDVLKDASTTAIYGIRAANGVVIITTKKGSKNGLQVSVDAYNAFQSRPKMYKVLNAQQWATLANEVADADSSHNFNELPIWRNPSALTNVDWQKAMYRTALTQSYTIGIRGGNDKTQVSTSVGFYNQKGIVQGSYFKRVTLGLNLDMQASKWLKSSTSAKYTYQDGNNPFGTGSLYQLSELPPTLDSGNRFTNLIKDGNGNYGFYNPKNTYVAKYGNPLYTIESNQYKNITNYFLASSSLEATIIDGLKIKTNAGVNISLYNGSFYQPQDLRSSDQYNLGGATQNALYSQHMQNSFEWLWENTLSYNKSFGDHSVWFDGGISAQKRTYTFMGGSGIPPNSAIRDLSSVSNLHLDTYNSTGGPGNGQTQYAIASQFGRVRYQFREKYFMSATLRRDGSSKFDESHQFGIFPTASVGWRIKDESFLQSVTWLSDLKLRGSYGKVGNETPLPLFQYLALYQAGLPAALSGNLGYPFDKIYQTGIAQSQPANPNLKWETDYLTDAGLDASFLGGALTFTADYFARKSQDFLLNLAASPQTGYLFISRNVGSMENKGIELALTYNHNVTGNFHYGATLTFTAIRNKLTSLTSGAKYITNFGGLTVQGNGWPTFTETNIGQAVGEFYGYKSLGVFQTKQQIDDLNAKSKAQNSAYPYYQVPVNTPGDRYFQDTNGDGHVDATDQTSLGSPLPKFYGGLNLDAGWKNWDINLYFYGVYGNKIINYMKSTLQSFQNRGFVGVENVSLDYYLHRWTPTNPSNTMSRATYNDDAVGSNVPSSAWIENGSFLKLKNMTIGYSVPNSVIRSLHISKIRVYASSQNLFTITKYSGLDPEIGLQNGNATQNGVDNGTYPSSRFFTVGLNATF